MQTTTESKDLYRNVHALRQERISRQGSFDCGIAPLAAEQSLRSG